MNDDGQQSITPDVLRGLVYTHNRASANTAAAHEANAALRALVGLLVEEGLVDREAFEARRAQSSVQLRREYLECGMAVAMQDFDVSKYEFKGGAVVDCENRLHLCKAACCRLPFALSKQDIQEGIVKWDLGQPYLNARDKEWYCVHMERGACHCRIYQHRPIPCRGYDCRNGERIWLDFENGVTNPHVNDSVWLEYLETHAQILISMSRET